MREVIKKPLEKNRELLNGGRYAERRGGKNVIQCQTTVYVTTEDASHLSRQRLAVMGGGGK